MGTEAAAADPAPVTPAAAPAAVADVAPAKVDAPAPAADAKTDAAPAAAPAEPKAAPSLLASADVAKRDGAPAADAKTTDAKSPDAAASDPKSPDAKTDGDAKPPAADAKTDAPKPDAKADGEAKPDGAKPDAAKTDALAEKPPAPPTYDAYKLPETLKLNDKELARFNGILAETEVATKADHAAMQGLGQKMMDLYAEEVQRIGEQVSQHQRDVWNRLNEQRIGELKSDEQLGGNRIETTLGNAKYVIEQFGGSKQEQEQLLAILDNGGVSNYRGFIRFLHNVFERTQAPQPVQPNLPGAPQNRGQRNWYEKIDGASAA